MTRAWLVFLKELRDALRDRRTLRAVLLSALLPGPLMLVLLSVLVSDVERQAESRELVVVGLAHAPTLDNYLRRQTWTTRDAPADYEDALRRKRLGDAVLVLPADFEQRLASGEQPRLRLIFDSANPRASASQRRVQELLAGFARERGTLALVSRGVAPGLLQPLAVDAEDLADPAARASNFTSMLPFLVMMAMVSGALAAALDSTAGERERGSLEPLLMNPTPGWSLVAGKWAAVALLGMFIAVLACGSLMPGQWLLRNEQLSAMFRFGPPEVAAFLALLLPLAGLLAAVLMVLGIHGRSVKEAQAGASLVVLAVSFLPLVPMLSTRGEQPWQLWLPVVAQSTLMSRVLRGEAMAWHEVAGPALACALLTVLALALVVRQMGRVVAR
ncbi:ABC transporter permease [Ideonella alba]|uniref:ABC transporter permease n=1 Tax=Ideonella alba TaxID=2824118 RepID=A0A940YFE3_9BURK|nr:ABC transporter permease [Ideonella alba]MBQ0933173.1 ABC transporter permease [Ideonella alba]